MLSLMWHAMNMDHQCHHLVDKHLHLSMYLVWHELLWMLFFLLSAEPEMIWSMQLIPGKDGIATQIM